jgi:hypothetical protein
MFLNFAAVPYWYIANVNGVADLADVAAVFYSFFDCVDDIAEITIL